MLDLFHTLQAWGVSLVAQTGLQLDQRLKSDRFALKVLELVGEGQSYREIIYRLGLSRNTVLDIVKRDRAA
jgi:DNA-binding NarL/FixJ family response regulator